MTVQEEDRMLFLAGNFEVQRLAGYNDKKIERAIYSKIRNHFIYSCLISDRVIQPVAHYYQSEITRKISSEFNIFFRPYKDNPPIAYYAVSYQKGTFHDDAFEKAESYTKNFQCYSNKIIRERITKSISQLSNPYIRKGELANSISDIIINNAKSGGNLFEFVFNNTFNEQNTKVILSPLVEICEEKKFALIPEYLEMKLHPNTPTPFFNLMRYSLLDTYMNSTARLYGAYPNNPLIRFYAGIDFPYQFHYLDTNLFQDYVKLLPNIEDSISRLTPKQLIELKYSTNFIMFLAHYKQLILNIGLSYIKNKFTHSILNEYAEQKGLYQKRIQQLVENQNVMRLLSDSLNNSIKDKNKIIIPSSNFIDYNNIPTIAFANEVTEKFSGRYEEFLLKNIESYSSTLYGNTINKQFGVINLIINKK
ncbi:MAG: hypothetical protein HXX16_16050 [Bacteroidales bacterium]|nr:hypothetical protein [Bacteroidales bacterium]